MDLNRCTNAFQRLRGTLVLWVAGLFLCTAACNTLFANEWKWGEVAIAEDNAEWPPYTFFERTGTTVTERVVGFSVDIIDAIFRDNGMTYRIDMMPYARALENVRIGKKHSMILSASYNEDRAKTYYMSAPYYQTAGCFFYSKKNHPAGLDITCKADLDAYKIGGMHKFNYTHYGQHNENVDRGTYTFDALIEKMKFGRVDLFLENYETIAGYKYLGKDYLADPDLGYGRVEDVEAISFYMWFSKNEKGAALKQLIDQGVARLRETGEYDELYNEYFSHHD